MSMKCLDDFWVDKVKEIAASPTKGEDMAKLAVQKRLAALMGN